MCGIAGIVGFDGHTVDPAVLRTMNDRIAHRGPDGEAYLLGRPVAGSFQHVLVPRLELDREHAGVCVGLGHRRLAILDLSERGLQPMSSGDGLAWIVFNGEIYNYRELRAELEAQGHTFRTQTDTEVLLHAYIRWGEDCLGRLQGMFAFAVWDSARRCLFCARDRLGIKPFYYACLSGYFLFASEIKSLLAFPGLKPEADRDAVIGFLAHANCDYGETTLAKGVKALPAAHCLTLAVETGRISVRPYWRLEPQYTNGATSAQRIAGLRELLLDSMRKHLNSDVRAGSCLSGGLDSSTVVALAGKIWREQPEAATAIGDSLFTFTSCYRHRQIDERAYALSVARSVGATPHLVFPSADDFWSDFERMAWHQDMPFGGLSYYAQWRVMRAAKEAGVKVLLDGQGGDEIFGGYAKFRYAYLASLLRSGRIPTMLRELAATVRQGDRYVLDIRNGFRYLPKRVRHILNVDSLLSTVLKTDWDDAVSTESTPATRWWRNALSSRANGCPMTLMQQIQVDDIVTDTLPQLLRMEDRSSMAFSLEARVPLLDHRLVEYGLSLPDHLKVHRGWSKFAVREAMQNLLPESVRLRKSKLGFAAPDRAWLAHDLRKRVAQFIQGDLCCANYVDPIALRRWYQSAEGKNANTESYLGLFRILSLEMWMRAFSMN